VLRHENEISGTTDVARHPEFAKRRTTREVDGAVITGWFTEDFTWDELTTLRARERVPALRKGSARFDGLWPILRLEELVALVDRASERHGRELGLVVEIKHATYFAAAGLPLDQLVDDALGGWGSRERLIVESFEQGVLTRLDARGRAAQYVYLLDKKGAAADLRAEHGKAAPTYADQLRPASLGRLAEKLDGVSLSRAYLDDSKTEDPAGLVAAVHAAGLDCYTWTLRAENNFLPKKRRIGGEKSDPGDWLAEFRRIYDLGVDGVFADQPDLAVIARDAQR
jgi:glycerophosphoryl diester phosphodiesterase